MNDFLIGKSTCAKCGKTFPYIKATLYAPKWCNDCISRYADAEAEGRLVVLPCKVGDEFWTDYVGVKKVKCSMLTQKADGTWKGRFSVVNGWGSGVNVSLDEIGKTVFLTREEAEAKLKGESNG